MNLKKKVIFFILVLMLLSSTVMGPLSYYYLKNYSNNQSPFEYFVFILVVTLLGALICSLIAFWLLNSLFVKRISRLNEALISLRKGVFKEIKIDGESKDEIDELAASFNNILINLHDITLSQNFFNNIIQTVDNSIIVLDGNSKISFANRVTAKLLNYEEKEMIGLHFGDINPWFKAYGVKSQMKILETTYVRSDKKRLPVSFSCFYLKRSEGKNGGFICIARDITKEHEIGVTLKKAKYSAEISEKAKTQFLANMGHELRTPLNAINGFTRHLLNTEEVISLTDKSQGYLKQIQNSGLALLEMIDNILDLSKIDKNEYEINEQNCIVKELVKEAFNSEMVMAKEKNIKYTLELSKDLPDEIKTDPTILKHILINLLNNGIKFSRNGGEVSLNISKEGQGLVILVTDNGIGIHQDYFEEIYTEFFQIDQSNLRTHEGTGIGLFIVSNLVKLLGGKLTLESELKKGSKFLIHLPYKEAEDEIVWANRELSALELKDIKILLVEDNLMNQEVTRTLFEDLNMDIEVAENGLLGLEKVESWKPDIVFMDIQMPEMDGIEATKKLREKDQYLDLPIIGLSADAYSEQREKGIKAGMDDYITKPLMVDDIVRLFKKFIGLK